MEQEQLESYSLSTIPVVSATIMDAALPSYDRTKSYISLDSYPTHAEPHHEVLASKGYQHPFNILSSATDPIQHYQTLQRLDGYLDPPPPTPRHDKLDTTHPAQSHQPNASSVPKKRGRKPKNCIAPSRHENKLNRNSNRSYINYKGVEIEPRKFNDFQCKCVKKCSWRLSASERMAEFDKFWALSSYDAQTAFIAAKVTEHPVKKRYGRSEGIKKDFSRTYSLCSTAVCRDMFCRTLQISSGRINTALTKIRMRTAIKDQRGVRKASALKMSNRIKIEIRNTRKNLDSIESGYNKNTEKYLPLDKSSINHQEIENVQMNQITQNCSAVTNNGRNDYPESSSKSISSDAPSQQVSTGVGPVYLSYITTGCTPLLLPPMNPNTNPMDVCSVIFTEGKDNLPYNAMKPADMLPPSTSDERPKKGRKPKYNQSRQENKVNRNNNKAYVNYKGVLVEPKKFIDFHCDCSKKCFQKLSSDDRLVEFEKFWALPYDSQTAYIVAAVSEHPVKRRYSAENETKKDFTRKYALGSVPVCREMFCRTLHISPGRINTALKKYRLRSTLTDQRGVKQGGHNKLPTEKRNCVIRFIKRIPVYKSHYCKEKSKSRFLPPEMTLAKLYDLYKEEEKDNAVSNASFKKIFYNTFNLRTKETCHDCEAFKNKLRKEQNSVKKLELKQRYEEHKAVAVKAQKYLEYDMLLAKKYSDVECITFDMERTLPLPRIPTNFLCYKRSLWLFNLGIHSSKKDQSYCYIWPEGQAGKGAQEVGSCLLKHAKEEIIWSPDLSHLILWTDSCGGLNRNVKLTLMLKSLLQSCPTLKTIKIKFLISGHSSLPNQRDFTDIERTLKTQSHLYTPDDYVNLMRYSRKKKPLIVKSMNHQDFLSTDQLEKHIINPKLSLDKQKINWSEVREISMFVQDLYTIYFKTDYDGENIIMDIRPRPDGQQIINFMHLLTPLWPMGKPITPAKLKDLKSILHMIPAHAKSFYSNLQCGSNNEEDVDGLNDELDFEIEYNHK